jgi:hypothetical protein
MKRYTTAAFLMLIIGNIGALDTESYQFINHLLEITRPGPPELYEDGVLFTAPATYRKVGIAFAHEGFARVYWFQKLTFIKDQGPPPAAGKAPPVQYEDSGVLFYVYTPPRDLEELEYRLIIDGLWVKDPLNPRFRRDEKSGIALSVTVLPERGALPGESGESPGMPRFNYEAPSGETITVAGSFNGWDPFMYELRETAPGRYSLSLPLPPGTYQYVFYHRGQRFPDPANRNRAYTREGGTASEVVVP